MSRVGKRPITLPEGVTASLQGQVLTVKGPKGTLSRTIHTKVDAEIDAESIAIKRQDDTEKSRGIHGLMRALVSNMVVGVSQGFVKSLEIAGVGYRVSVQSNVLNLSLGYSHPIEFALPPGITASIVDKQSVIRLEGIENELLGQTAARIRALRACEPYKGKGIRYVGEHVFRKAGKAGGKK